MWGLRWTLWPEPALGSPPSPEAGGHRGPAGLGRAQGPRPAVQTAGASGHQPPPSECLPSRRQPAPREVGEGRHTRPLGRASGRWLGKRLCEGKGGVGRPHSSRGSAPWSWQMPRAVQLGTRLQRKKRSKARGTRRHHLSRPVGQLRNVGSAPSDAALGTRGPPRPGRNQLCHPGSRVSLSLGSPEPLVRHEHFIQPKTLRRDHGKNRCPRLWLPQGCGPETLAAREGAAPREARD